MVRSKSDVVEVVWLDFNQQPHYSYLDFFFVAFFAGFR